MARSIAAIVPATDRPPTLERCLAALRASTEPPDELHVIDEPPGCGPAEARNRGAERANSDLLAFVDADVEIAADALARARRAFAADPDLVALFGSYDDAPAAPGAVSQFRNLLHHHIHTSSPGRAETFWAGLGFIRRTAFLDAGGFDAGRYAAPSIEDIELGARLTAKGAKIVLDPEIRGKHLKAWSLAEMVRTDLARRGVPWVRLQLDTGRRSTALNLGARHRASALLALGAVVAAARRRAAAGIAVLSGLVALNSGFFALLLRRGGPRLVAAGLPLHVIHHLVSIAAAAAGSVLHLRDRRSASTPAATAAWDAATSAPTAGPSPRARPSS